MFKRVMSVTLVVLVLNVFAVKLSHANSRQDRMRVQTDKVKESVRKLGTGPEARVDIKPLDGRKLKGYVQEAREDVFVVVDGKTGAANTVD